ncbi:DmsC/YnfH family molybdoenzyme membrane anchor subunit, partial [Glaesserella parasuis]|nr:DmsC/YnfH family molybdoenzyme membrane anchor subunit [Glaesserella parasuis]
QLYFLYNPIMKVLVMGFSFAHILIQGVKTAIFTALDLVPDYLTITFIHFGLIIVDIVLLLVALKKRTTLISFSGFALILIGELLGRTLFYGLHMTVGLKALGG